MKDATSTVTSTLATHLAPNCANGATGDVDGYAGIHYYVSQAQQSIHAPIELTGTGVQVGVGWDGARPLYVELTSQGQGTTWCAPMPGPGNHLIPYSAFDTSCQGQGAAFPLDALVDSVGVVAWGTETSGEGFNFCINELRPGTGPVGPPPGYLNGPTWYGHGFPVTDGISTVTSDLSTDVFPNCADGTTTSSPGAFAGIQYSVNQPVQGTNTPIYFNGQGVIVSVDWDEARPLYARITSSAEGTSWCAPIPGIGSQTIPKEAFNTECINMTGNPLPGEVLIDSVGIVALSTGVADDTYGFCVNDLRESVGGGPPLIGYMSTPTWHGYGFGDVSADVVNLGTDLFEAIPPNCANGTTTSDPASYGGLLYSVNESPAGADNSPIGFTGAGVWVSFYSLSTERPHYAKLRGQAADYCALLPGNNLSTFLPYSAFTDDCINPANGTPLDTGTEQVLAAGVIAPSTGQAESFDVCVAQVQPTTGPFGYLDGPDWFGDAIVYPDGTSSSNVSSDVSMKPGPNCITGQIDASPGAFVRLHYYTDQPFGGSPAPVQMNDFGGMAISLDTQSAHPIELEIFDSASSNTYCAMWSGASGSALVPWSSFNTDCVSQTGLAFVPAEALIDEVGIKVVSTGSLASYDVCITQLEEELIPQ